MAGLVPLYTVSPFRLYEYHHILSEIFETEYTKLRNATLPILLIIIHHATLPILHISPETENLAGKVRAREQLWNTSHKFHDRRNLK